MRHCETAMSQVEAIWVLKQIAASACGLLAMTILFVSSVFAFEVKGTISVNPPYPAAAIFTVDEKHAESCGPEQASPALMVSSDGGVRNAVVWLDPHPNPNTDPSPLGGEGRVRGDIPTLHQKNCRFDPHVLIVPAGQEFQITNEDPMVHDVRIFDDALMLERFEMNEKGKPVTRRFDKPGRYLVRCGFHKWMHAYIINAGHDYYAVTDAGGGFRLDNVPSGAYTLHVWHERLGEASQMLDLTGDERNLTHVFEAR